MKQMSLVSLLVKDYDQTIEFYTKKLGFVVAEDLPFGEKRWVTLKLPDNRESVLALGLAETNEDLALVGRQGGSTPFFGILTDDCLGEYNRMKNLGVRFHSEPRVEPYGTGVTLEDLYGNKIYMNQEPS